MEKSKNVKLIFYGIVNHQKDRQPSMAYACFGTDGKETFAGENDIQCVHHANISFSPYLK